MAWTMYQRPVFDRREGSIGTKLLFQDTLSLSFFFFVGINDKKILEHNFGRDDGSRSSFWPWY